MTFRVQRITRVGDHGYWVRCQAVAKRMDPFIFWLEPGSALPPIGLEFKATFDWNQEHSSVKATFDWNQEHLND